MVLRIFAVLFVGSLFAAAFFMPRPSEQGTTSKEQEANRQEALSKAPVLTNQPTDQPLEQPTNQPSNPTELGNVHWLRDLEAGKAKAEETGKPLLILFQEVPGCSNCTRFGSGPLRHPLIVEAIETYFVPVCIYNNKGGQDGEALKTFGEPAWNNPVVRIVNTAYQDVTPRMDNFGSSFQLVDDLRKALVATEQEVPLYLHLLAQELRARESGLATATFSMYCFWSGEGTFGAIEGVIATESGYQDGKEVVRVTYDSAVLPKAELEKLARAKNTQACAANTGFRADREPKYYLAQTSWRFVPMTSLQAARANSLVGQGQSPETVLSPRQVALSRRIEAQPEKKWKNAIGVEDLVRAWEQLTEM